MLKGKCNLGFQFRLYQLIVNLLKLFGVKYTQIGYIGFGSMFCK